MKVSRLTSAAFAAALLLGACSTTKSTPSTVTNDDFGHVEAEVVTTAETSPIPGPAKVDSEGRVYTSSAAPGRGNASTLGTNTNVNIIPDTSSRSTVAVTTTLETPLENEPVVVTESTTMTSSSRLEDTAQETPATTTTPTTRSRMRKD